jgi:ABC-type nitrate/sulfonate/bicarbonate transport system substrate-binding protein
MSTAAKPAIDTLWYTRCSVPTAVGIAVQQGLIAEEFARDGLTLRSVQESNRREDRESHFDHKLTNQFRQGGNIPAIWTKSAGRDTRLLGLTWTDEYQAIITLPATGIKTVADLKGRRLSIGRNRKTLIDVGRAQTLRGYLNALRTVGLSEKDVQIIDVIHEWDNFAPVNPSLPKYQNNGFNAADRRSWSDEIQALVRGQVDAVYVKGARGAEIAALIGAVVVIDLGNHPDPLIRSNNPTPRTFTVDGALLDRHPDIVSRVLARVIDASDWAAAHPAEARAYVGREIGATDEWVHFAYGDVHQHLTTELRDDWIAALADWTKFLAVHGFIPSNFDVKAWIDPRPLEAAHRLRGTKAA